MIRLSHLVEGRASFDKSSRVRHRRICVLSSQALAGCSAMAWAGLLMTVCWVDAHAQGRTAADQVYAAAQSQNGQAI
jgi:hypothetical protein